MHSSYCTVQHQQMEKFCGHPRQLAEESSGGKETKMVEDFFAGDWEKKYLPQILTFYQIQIFNEQKSFFCMTFIQI